MEIHIIIPWNNDAIYERFVSQYIHFNCVQQSRKMSGWKLEINSVFGGSVSVNQLHPVVQPVRSFKLTHFNVLLSWSCLTYHSHSFE